MKINSQHRTKQYFIKISSGIITAVLLTGCANLESVRDFSKQSASLTSGPEAIDYWANWDKRSQRYNAIVGKLPPINNVLAKGPTGPLSPPTKEQVQAIKALQSVLSAYMSKLGALAEDDLVDISKQVDGLVENLNNLPSNNPDEKKKANDAYGEIIKLVKLPLDAYRHRKVKQLIVENDTNIQALTKGLSVAMGSVAKFADAERQSVLTWYEITTGDYPSPPSFANAYQWEKDRKSIIESHESKAAAISAYEKSLVTIGSLHSEMAKNLSAFNTQSFKILASSLKDARSEIIAARDQYKKAFE